MAKKSETKRGSSRSSRSTRQGGRSRSIRTQPVRRKEPQSQMNRGEENMDTMMEEE